jgi:hypothetical protein
MKRRFWIALPLVACSAWCTWDPGPSTEQRFDLGRNGVWAGHRWWTGREVRSGVIVPAEELESFVRRIYRHGITEIFVHAGPILPTPDGTIRDPPADAFFALQDRLQDRRLLPWVGCYIEVCKLEEPLRKHFVATLLDLQQRGVRGVHLDIEPIADEDLQYLALLDEIRAALGPEFFLSHATHRAGPFGISAFGLEPYFWSEEYYAETMKRTDQTVVMAYDTRFDLEKLYIGFVRHQTRVLSQIAADHPEHELLIGVPTYEDNPATSNPAVENVRNAALGVRAGLEEEPDHRVRGIAVYADWVTSEEDWTDYRAYWQ